MIYIKKIDNNENHNFARSKLWEAITNPTTKGWDWVKDWFGIKSLGREIGDNNKLLNGGIPKGRISESTVEKLLTNKEWGKRVPEALADAANETLKTKRAKKLLSKSKSGKINIMEQQELDSLNLRHDNLLNVARGIEEGKMLDLSYSQLPKDLKKMFDKIVKSQKKIKVPGHPDTPPPGFIGTGVNVGNFVRTGDTWWQNTTGNVKYAFDAARAHPVGQTIAAPIGVILRNPAKTTVGAAGGYVTYKALSDDTPEESNPSTPDPKIESLDTSYVDERKFYPTAE